MIQYENIQKAMGVDIAISTDMSNAIYKWDKIYANKATWLSEDVKSLQIAASVCSEMARLVTNECSIIITGSPMADYIANQTEHFFEDLPKWVEYACCVGGAVFKPYIDNTGICIDVVKQGNFFPTAFSGNGKLTGVIFPEFKRKGKNLYTRLEYHNWDGDTYTIDNRAFVSKKAVVKIDNIIQLGTEINLERVAEWSNLEPHVEFKNAVCPLFAYFKVPVANNVDTESPLGVSVFSRAVDQIKDADEQYGRTIWEYQSKETAIQAADEFFKRDRYGKPIIPQGKKRLYHAMGPGIADGDKPFFNAYSPEIRDQSMFNGLNKIKQEIEFKCGLAYGTISDPQIIEKTAEEIKSSKQRSYSTVKAIQNALQNAISDMLDAIVAWLMIEPVVSQGKIEIGYDWDDSLIVDKKYENEQLRADVSMGAVGLVEYRMKRFGETKEQAIEMLIQAAEFDPEPDPDPEEE
jgi:A118 family predicted phage portal protein